MASRHVHESLCTIDKSSWSVGDKLVLFREKTPGGIWHDSDGWSYTLSEPSDLSLPPQSDTTQLPFPLVYKAGCGLSGRLDIGHAVWKVGNAFLKVMAIGPQTAATREHATLQALRERNVAFTVPEVHYHGEWEGRYYIVTFEAPGQTLEQAWWHMDKEEKEACVASVTTICKDLATWESAELGGVDGNELHDHHLLSDHKNLDFSRKALEDQCTRMGMDCSVFVFYHCDLGPGNVLWDTRTKPSA